MTSSQALANEEANGVMNLVNYPRRDYSIEQYEVAPCYELTGQTFRLIMDSGYDYDLSFDSDEIISWSIVHGEKYVASYVCLKSDDTTYFVGVHPSKDEHHIYVLDFEQRLVTRLVCTRKTNPKFPYLFKQDYDFGAIDMKGYRLPFKRHGFTTEHLGTSVQWRWSMNMYTKHAYLESDYYRITWDDDGEAAESFDTTNEMLPTTDEHCRYVKIKDNMYLFTLSEENEERALGDLQHFRGDILSLLQNYDRMIHMGCGFGTTLIDGKLESMYVGLTAYGNPLELPEKFLNAKNPFVV